jgi:predicted dehydrogenase
MAAEGTRYRAGIIACGIIAQAHLRAYRKIAGVEVVAGADVSPEVRARWSSEHGMPRMYATAAELLERGGTHPLDGRSARAGMEILMAVYESARRRARIDLPYPGLGNPLEETVSAGVL